MRDFEEQPVPRGVKLALSLGSAALFLAGFVVGAFLGWVTLGVLIFAVGVILFALRGYLNTGDRAVTGALIFVALVAIGIQLIVLFLGP
ncbi:MAG: hypothetical protein ACFB50_13770 [Rubrobacteraceae bacterium]